MKVSKFYLADSFSLSEVIKKFVKWSSGLDEITKVCHQTSFMTSDKYKMNKVNIKTSINANDSGNKNN